MTSKKKVWVARIYLGRDHQGKQQFYWVPPGRFATKRERDLAVAKAKIDRPWEAKPVSEMTGNELADRYLKRYETLNKRSSFDTAKYAIQKFRAEFGDRPITQITPIEAEDWAASTPHRAISPVVTMFNYAKKKLLVIENNPFAGLGADVGTGRGEQPPPTLEQFAELRDACHVLGDYAHQMRDLIDFAALTLMRPGELYELRHTDIDIAANRIRVSRRLYRGVVDVPKNGKPKTIALVPPAREVLMRQRTRGRDDGLVWVSRRGKRLSTNLVSAYWLQVQARANLRFDFYLATKHYGVHALYKLGLSKRAIAAQAGWSEETVDAMLAVYGHTDLVALSEVDALYANLSDASVTQEATDAQ